MDPTENYILNINKINISDWQLFLDNNKAIKARLENMNSNIAYMKAYIDIIKTDSETSYNNLQKIKTAGSTQLTVPRIKPLSLP